jgi:hypothetical protein
MSYYRSSVLFRALLPGLIMLGPTRGAEAGGRPDAQFPPSVELKFSPGTLSISPDGALAIAVGNQQMGFPQNDKTVPLALVDLKKHTVVATRTLSGGIATAAVDAHYAYVASQSSDVVFVLNHKDLNQARRIFTQGRVQELVCVDDRLLFMRSMSSNIANGTTVMRLPSCEPAAAADVGLGVHIDDKGKSMARNLPVLTGDSWWFDGILYDSHLQKPQVVSQPPGVWQCGGDLSRQRQGVPIYAPFGNPVPAWLQPWGITVDNSGIHRGTTQIGQFGPGAWNMSIVALAAQPAVVRLRYDQNPNSLGGVDLEFYDLVRGSKAHVIPLTEGQLGWSNLGIGPMSSLKLQVRKDLILCQVHNRIFMVSVPQLNREKFPPNLNFKLDQPVLALAAENKDIPIPPLTGTEPPVEVSLLPELPGVEVDKNGALVHVHGEALRAKALESIQLSGLANQRRSLRAATTGRASNPGVAGYLSEVSPLFEKLVGRKPKGVPLWMSIGLIARDKGVQSAEFAYGIFLEMPAERLQAMERVQPGNESGQQLSSETRGSRSPAGRAGRSGVEQRIDDLERKLDQINQRLDKLTQMLENQRGSPSRQPK